MTIKVLITFFVIFALSRAYLRYRDRSIKFTALVIWVVVWGAVTFFAWWPKFSDLFANSIGIGRGVDALVYISIVALFYAVFRIYVKLQFIEHQITSLVSNLALKDKRANSNDKQKESSPGN